MDLFDVTDRRILITGASSGLGRHFARALAARGARVVLAARRRERLQEVAEDIASRGGQASCVAMDVTEEASVEEGVRHAASIWGGLDALVNNSGIAGAKPALELTTQEWDEVLGTNLRGAWLVARNVARRMVDEGTAGSIVNIASIAGIRVAGGLSAYAASKAGLIRLTNALALELARYRIRVNAIAPGYIRTEINEEFFRTPAGQALVKRIPARRLGEPGELEGALLLLLSGAGSYMSGSVVVVDGGHLQAGL